MEITLENLGKKYELEIEQIVKEIKKQKAKIVLLQFPDGIKAYATKIVDLLRERTNAEFLIWFGTCYGACDTPVLSKKIENKIDLMIQFGHNELMPDY